MRTFALSVAGILLATTAIAQSASPPAPAGPLGPIAAAEPPPPAGGPRGDRPPPPPAAGAAVILDRGANGVVHVDVRCARADTTKDCADIASRLLAETGAR